MGGAQAGEVASKLAASALESGSTPEGGGLEHLTSLIQEANRRVYDRSTTDPAASGMGTTMTVALVEGMTVVIGHVGDSRAYLLRGERMEQLTEDHSLVNELLKSGKLSAEEAQVHPQRSVITRAVGTDPDVDVDAFTIDAEDGDVFLHLLRRPHRHGRGRGHPRARCDKHRDDLDRPCKSLVAAANRGGGEDNITAVAFRIASGGADETAQMPAVEPEEQTMEALPAEPAVDTMVTAGADEDELLEPGSEEALEAARGEPPGVRTGSASS